MSRKRPIAPGTRNPFGCGSSFPLLSHWWNRRSFSFHRATNWHRYSTTSSLSWPSTYILFCNFLYRQPSPASQRRAVCSEIEGLAIPFCLIISWISVLATTSTTSRALKYCPFMFSVSCNFISRAISSSSRGVHFAWPRRWRGSFPSRRYVKTHSQMRRAWLMPCP
jgi:hypothetical protein